MNGSVRYDSSNRRDVHGVRFVHSPWKWFRHIYLITKVLKNVSYKWCKTIKHLYYSNLKLVRYGKDCLALKHTANSFIEYVIADLIVYGTQGIIQ